MGVSFDIFIFALNIRNNFVKTIVYTAKKN